MKLVDLSISGGWIAKALGWISVFLLPIKATMIAVSALVVVDLITGIWAAYRRGEKITSSGIRRTISKTVAYQVGIISSLVMEQYFMPEIPVVKIVAGLIAITEFKSLMENLSSITGIDFVQEVIAKLQGHKGEPVMREVEKKPEDSNPPQA